MVESNGGLAQLVDINQKRDIAESFILAHLIREGFTVLKPVSASLRYDLAIDDDGKLVRIQCKFGRLYKGSIRFKTCSVDRSTKVRKSYTHSEVDMFGVYCSETDSVYLVPLEEVEGLTEAALRIEPSANNQESGIRWAKNYILGD